MSLAEYPLLSDWLEVRDGRLILRTGKVDIGQRISTAIAEIAHQELTIPHDRIELETARTSLVPDEGITSGSNSIEQSGHAMRCASATLRRCAITCAAERFGGAPDDWRLEDGFLSGPGSNRPVDLLEVLDGFDLAVPVDATAAPRAPDGRTPQPVMRGLSEMVTGRFVYVHDLDVPGMLHARVVRPPHARARLTSVPEAALARLEKDGLKLVRDGSFLAIAGPEEWTVTEAALRLATTCVWDTGGGLSEDDVFGALVPARARSFVLEDSTPKISAPVPPGLDAPDVVARYERPFTMHGALAPSAAMATYAGGMLTVQTHSQGIYPLRESMADSLGLDPGMVELIHTPGSGCYGHNGADDAAFEAALVAMAIPDTPILLKWTRAEENAWEPYGTAMAVELAATLDGDGGISSFSADTISGTHRGRPRPGADRVGPARLLANQLRADRIGPAPAMPNLNRHGGMHRNLDPIYDFPEKRLVKNLVDGLPHRTSALRCLGAAANVFALESFLDEIVRERNLDPFDYRRSSLRDPRSHAVLDRLEQNIKSPAKSDFPGGRGIAFAQYKNAMTRVGVCVDLEVNDNAEVRLLQASIVADAGRVIDLAGLEAQLEGGFLQAASWALHEQVTWDRSGITSLDWETYPVIRFDQIPEIAVDILDYPQMPSVGAGEAASGPTLAAISNAICDATGLRLRRLPFTSQAILDQALAT